MSRQTWFFFVAVSSASLLFHKTLQKPTPQTPGLKNRLRFRSRDTLYYLPHSGRVAATLWSLEIVTVLGTEALSPPTVQTLHQTRARATFFKKSSPFSSPTNNFSHRLSPRKALTRPEPQQQFARSRPRSRATNTCVSEGVSRRMPFSKCDSRALSPPNLKNKTVSSTTNTANWHNMSEKVSGPLPR